MPYPTVFFVRFLLTSEFVFALIWKVSGNNCFATTRTNAGFATPTEKSGVPAYHPMVDGEVRTWTGQGRMPAQIATAVENGKSLEDFLITPVTA